jgi:TetR/AcrR family transcriptional regulator, lmrAB and yxaGH operons repressor
VTRVDTGTDNRGSRERILEAAIRLLRRQGYASTGIKQIVEEGDAPLGSVYHHFPGGKEQLTIEAIETAGERIRRTLATLADVADVPAAVNNYFVVYAERLRDSAWELGCPIANVSQETAAGNEPIRAACTRVFDTWRETLARVFTDAGVAERDADELATFVLTSYEGALTMSRAVHDTRPLVVAGAAVASVVHSHLGDTPRAG